MQIQPPNIDFVLLFDHTNHGYKQKWIAFGIKDIKNTWILYPCRKSHENHRLSRHINQERTMIEKIDEWHCPCQTDEWIMTESM